MKNAIDMVPRSELQALLDLYDRFDENELVAQNAALRTKINALESYMLQGNRRDKWEGKQIACLQQEVAYLRDLHDRQRDELAELRGKLEWHRSRARAAKRKKAAAKVEDVGVDA